MKGSAVSRTKYIIGAFMVAAGLVVLACGTSATATPSARSIPGPIPVQGPTAVPAISAATATPRPTPAPKVTEITLRVGTPFLDSPPAPAQGGFYALSSGIGETLFKLDKDLKPEPWLATGAKQLDGKTWEITLRQGVKFHSGALMDAMAVKASLERAVTLSKSAKLLLDVAQIEAKDPSTLVITTNGPSPILPALLTDIDTTIVDGAAAAAMGDGFKQKPVLTGPFKVESFQQDRELVVVRHSEYWGARPLADRVIFVALTDANTRVLALQSGDVDIAVDIPPESVATVKSDPNLVVRPAAPTAMTFMFINHRRDAWKDVRVRQAIALAIDREALVKGVTEGQGTVAAGLYPPTMVSCPQLRGYTFQPDKARQLLAQAGYRDKDGDGYVEKEDKTLSMDLLTYRQRPVLPPMAVAIQASLKPIGIKVNIRLVEQPIPAIQQGDWDGATWFHGVVTTGDPYWALTRLFATGGSSNRGGFSSPKIDELTGQVGQAIERQARQQLACTASQAVVDETPIVPLLFPAFNYGVAKKVTGFDEPHPLSVYLMDSKIGKR